MRRQAWERTRGYRALALAALLHALVLLVARSSLKSNASAPVHESPAGPADELEVELRDLQGGVSPPTSPGAATPPSDAAEGSKLASRERRQASLPSAAPGTEPSAAPGTESGAEPSAEPSEAVASLDSAEASGAPEADAERGHPIDLGIGADGWQRWVASNGSQPGEAPATKTKTPRFRAPTASTTGGLQEGLEEHDRALGLTPSGRVRTALFQAAHTDVAPQLGVAVFQVTVTRTGAVEVSLSSASSESSGWEAVAARAAAELRKTPPRIPASREGARVLVEIKAEAVYPNGMKEGQLEGVHVEATPPRFRSTEAAQADLKDRNPVAATTPGAEGLKPNVELPGVYIAQRGKVCGYRVGVSALGPILQGGCDPSNIGAKVTRMVHTRVREESLF